jgi:hypothetical protein
VKPWPQSPVALASPLNWALPNGSLNRTRPLRRIWFGSGHCGPCRLAHCSAAEGRLRLCLPFSFNEANTANNSQTSSTVSQQLDCGARDGGRRSALFAVAAAPCGWSWPCGWRCGFGFPGQPGRRVGGAGLVQEAYADTANCVACALRIATS